MGPLQDPRPQLLAGCHFRLSPGSGICSRPSLSLTQVLHHPLRPPGLYLAHFFGGNCFTKPFSITQSILPIFFQDPNAAPAITHLLFETVSQWTIRSEKLVTLLQHLAQRLHKVAQCLFAECVNEEGKERCSLRRIWRLGGGQDFR